MKLLILTLYPAPYRVALFELLAKKHDVTVFFEKDNDNRNPLYCQTSDQFHYDILNSDQACAAYEKAVKNLKQYDLVLLYEYSTKRSGKLILSCMLHRIRYAINCDGAVEISQKFPRKQIKSFFIRHAAMLFAGGSRAKEYFLSYGAKEDKIFVHNFTSVYENEIESQPSPEIKEQMRREWGIKGKTVTVSVGQFIPRKRFDLLIDAWATVGKEHVLYLIGSGKLRENIERRIAQSGAENIKILDFMPKSRLFRFYSLADLFVFSTREDIWGLVVNEALAKGLPVVSVDRCTAAVEMVRDGEDGYIIPEQDRAAMIEQIRTKALTILTDDALRKTMSANAIEVAKRYTYENMANVVNQAMEKCE